jgi:predicted AAA+ superfamily ATPase
MAYLLGVSPERLASDLTLIGPLLENFVVMELRKQITWSQARPQIYYFRLPAGPEVDVVLENAAGDLVGIEIKASAAVGPNDFRGLETLAELTGRRYRRGVVLYTGREAVPFGPRLHALPVSALWQRAQTADRP